MTMKVSMVLSLAFAAFAVQAAEQVPAKADAAKGQQIASQVCVGCHNADGNSAAAPNPKIAGQIEDYLYKQLRNFKAADGKPAERQNAIMNGMVAALSDEDMKGLAAWFSAQKLQPESAKNKASIELGQKLFRAGDASKGLPACAGCHGPTGAGMPAQYPRLSGQFADYTETQLKAFRNSERINDPNKMMRMVAIKMTDAEIKAVADYIAGLR
jgi:cytochrome c553